MNRRVNNLWFQLNIHNISQNIAVVVQISASYQGKFTNNKPLFWQPTCFPFPSHKMSDTLMFAFCLFDTGTLLFLLVYYVCIILFLSVSLNFKLLFSLDYYLIRSGMWLSKCTTMLLESQYSKQISIKENFMLITIWTNHILFYFSGFYQE
jgi:hypothetical protein